MIYNKKSLDIFIKKNEFDAYIVGSDQVWRKQYTHRCGENLFFLDFVPKGSKRIAYGVSFGLFEPDYSIADLNRLSSLYKCMDSVSLREISGVNYLNTIGWTVPKSCLVLDPTFLLSKDEYLHIIDHSDTKPSAGDMFCYLLDIDNQLKNTVFQIANDRKLTPFYASITPPYTMSIGQWLRSFVDSKFVLTNSYHGVVFSLIFNKPFMLIKNEKRGNARFETLQSLFGLKNCFEGEDWTGINGIIDYHKNKSILFLHKALFD